MDEAVERRTLSALHVQIGIGTALILGDYMILRVFTVLQESQGVYGQEKTSAAS